MGWYDTFRNTKINYYLINLSLALAPLIYFYFRSVTNPKRKFDRKDLIHFIPILLLILIRVVILIYDSRQLGFEDSQNGYLVIHFQWKYLDPIVALFAMLQMVIYLVLSFHQLFSYRQKIQHYFSNTFKLELNWLHIFLLIYSFLYGYYSIQTVVDATIIDLSWKQEWWYYLLSGLAIIYVGIRGYYTDLSALKGIEIESFLDNQTLSTKGSNVSDKIEELPPKVKALKHEIEIYFDKHKPYL